MGDGRFVGPGLVNRDVCFVNHSQGGKSAFQSAWSARGGFQDLVFWLSGQARDWSGPKTITTGPRSTSLNAGRP